MAILRDNVEAIDIYQNYYVFAQRKKGVEFSLPEGPTERLGKKTNDIYKLNWLSIEDLEENEHLLDEKQVKHLDALLNPHLLKDDVRPKYVTNTLMLTLCSFKKYDTICQCGTKGRPRFANGREIPSKKAKMFCKDWKYCDRCTFLKRAELYKELFDYYKNAKGNLYHVTLSMDNKYVFNVENYDIIEEVWDTLRARVAKLRKHDGYLEGVHMVEEISITSLYPEILVNPHIHMLVYSSEPIEDRKYSNGVKLNSKPVSSEEQWRHSINYMHKSVDLSTVYADTWDERIAPTMNRNLKEFVQGHREIFFGRKQITRMGIFHKNSKYTVALTKTQYLELHPEKDKRTKKQIKKDKSIAKAKAKAAELKKAEKACKKPKKKIQCKEPVMYEDFQQGVCDTLKVAELPEETVSLLKQAYAAYGVPGEQSQAPEQKKSTGIIGNTLGVLGSGLAAAGGAYLYGKYGNGGNNTLSNFTGVVNKGATGLLEKSTPFLNKAIDKVPLLNDQQRQGLRSSLPTSADTYAEGIKGYTVDQAVQGQMNRGLEMSPLDRKGTIFDNVGDDVIQKGLRVGEGVAAPVYTGAFIAAAPGMAGSAMNAGANVAGKTALTSGLAKPLQAGAGAMSKITGAFSKIPGASFIGRGATRTLGPAAAVFGAADAMDLGERNNARIAADPSSITQIRRPGESMGSSIWRGIKNMTVDNPIVNPGSMIPRVTGAIQQSSITPQFAKDLAGGVQKYHGKASGLGTHGLLSYYTGGLGGMAAPLINENIVKNNNNSILAAASNSTSNAMTDTFREALKMRDQGYNNPLAGWYKAHSPDMLEAYLGQLSDKQLAEQIRSLQPTR